MSRRKSIRLKGRELASTESLDFRRLIASASASNIEAACLYEYFRESEALRDALSGTKPLMSSFLSNLTLAQILRLRLSLEKAGFPKNAWIKVKRESQERLTLLLAEWREEQMQGSQVPGEPERIPPTYPPVVIEQAQFDLLAEEHDLPYYWPSNALEPKLFKTTAERRYFKGFIQIDEAYNETEAVRAFREWFRGRYPKTKSGGRTKWRDRLRQLSVMRIWKCEPDQWNRLQLVAEYCQYKGCHKEASAYKERCKHGHGDDPMGNAAKAEMSAARTEALTFFKDLFPGEKPMSYRASFARKR
jgi:hypothetical protein